MNITENVYQLESSKHSHVFLIKGAENILIDTGLPGLANRILTELSTLLDAPDRIQTILLTHHDVDHVGNAKRLQEATGAGIWAPDEDIPYLIGKKSRTGVKRIIQFAVRVKAPSLLGGYSQRHDFGEVRAIPAPGHTPGHTIFQYRKVLFTGDLFKVLNGRFQPFSKSMTWDGDCVKNSIAILKTLDFEWICPSHGHPIHNGPTVKEFLSQY